MFEYLGTVLVDIDPGFDVLRYLTVRTIGGTVTALLLTIFLGPKLINWLKRMQFQQFGVERGPDSHREKSGTPTMGGLLIISSLLISTLLWADLSNRYIWVCLFITSGFTLIGFLDDFQKIKYKDSKGISGKMKLLCQTLVSVAAVSFLYFTAEDKAEISLILLFNKDWIFEMGMLSFILFGSFVIVGSSNAVNLTDGLDGLATVPVMLVAACFAFISYVTGNIVFADYLQINYFEGIGEVAVFCGSIIGACLGFLWFNAPPAKIFMGDTGSLALGGSLGAVGILTKHEIVLAITGGLFVLEAVSVIVQVVSFKLTGKRVFKMAPIHHHFEKKGWPESTVVIRFWIISIILALIGLATLKLR